MKNSLLIFLIIGSFFFSFAIKNVNSETMIYNAVDDYYNKIPRKKDLVGKYTIKNDKKSYLLLNNDGTYSLSINVCNNYLLLSGLYELRDTKLILKNTIADYEDLKDNNELNFTIIDDHRIRNDENLVCTTQDSLFER